MWSSEPHPLNKLSLQLYKSMRGVLFCAQVALTGVQLSTMGFLLVFVTLLHLITLTILFIATTEKVSHP